MHTVAEFLASGNRALSNLLVFSYAVVERDCIAAESRAKTAFVYVAIYLCRGTIFSNLKKSYSYATVLDDSISVHQHFL